MQATLNVDLYGMNNIYVIIYCFVIDHVPELKAEGR